MIRHVGECQICEGRFKIHDGRVVLHGYKRPGDGYIHGECFGRNEEPYERSCALIPGWLGTIRARVVELKNFLARLRKGAVESIWVDRRGKPFELTRANADPPYTWDSALERKIWDVERELKFFASEVVRLQRRIDTWRLRPLEEVDERGLTAAERAERAQRAGERQAAKGAKDEKKNALARARGELLVQRRMILDTAGTLIQFAAARGDKKAALAVLEDLGKKKNKSLLEPSFASYGSLARLKRAGTVPADLPETVASSPERCVAYEWESDLRMDDALVALGFARRDPNRRTGIAYESNLWRK
jgi:hypothetical protein